MATWVRFERMLDGRLVVPIEVPPRLISYWQNRHRLSPDGVWRSSDAELQEIASFQHESLDFWDNVLYFWDSPNRSRRSILRGSIS